MHSNKSNRFSSEIRERAVRMVEEHRGEYPSPWACIESIAPKIGCVPQNLNDWVKHQEVDTGGREGLSTDERAHMKAIEREVKELRQANEALKLASAFFAQAALTVTATRSGSSRCAGFCRSPRRVTACMLLASAIRNFIAPEPRVTRR